MSPAPVDSAVLDRHATLSGTVSGHDLVVMGVLEGDLRLSGRLHVAAGSRLKATVQAAVIDLDGEFEGELRAETLRVAATARARGVFVAGRITIEEGALLDGNVQAPAAPAALTSDAGPASGGGARPEPTAAAETKADSKPHPEPASQPGTRADSRIKPGPPPETSAESKPTTPAESEAEAGTADDTAAAVPPV